MTVAGLGRLISSRLPPSAYVSENVTVFMASSFWIHGPPLDDQPGQLWRQTSMPCDAAHSMAYWTISNHCGESVLTSPSGMPCPMSRIVKPPRPASYMASMSALMPSFEMLQSIQCHQVCGLACMGGAANPSSR